MLVRIKYRLVAQYLHGDAEAQRPFRAIEKTPHEFVSDAGGQAGRVLPIFGAGALVHDRLDKDSPAVIALALQEAGHETPAQAGSLGVGLTAALQRARTAAGLENRNQR